jgi:hypothetical protein
MQNRFLYPIERPGIPNPYLRNEYTGGIYPGHEQKGSIKEKQAPIFAV